MTLESQRYLQPQTMESWVVNHFRLCKIEKYENKLLDSINTRLVKPKTLFLVINVSPLPSNVLLSTLFKFDRHTGITI